MSAAALRITAVVACVVITQIALMPHVRFLGVEPNLFLATVLTVGVLGGSDRGAVAGFLFGLVADALTGSPLGVTSLAYCVSVLIVGAIAHESTDYSWVVAVLTALGSVISVAMFVVVGNTALGLEVTLMRTVTIAVVTALTNLGFALFLVPSLRSAFSPSTPVLR